MSDKMKCNNPMVEKYRALSERDKKLFKRYMNYVGFKHLFTFLAWIKTCNITIKDCIEDAEGLGLTV